MKKILLFLGVAIFVVGGYIFYQKRNLQSSIIASFIPDNTIILLETNEISSPKNKVIAQLPLLSKAELQYQIFKKIGLNDKDISNLLLKKNLYFAVLPVGKDDFAFVNYLTITSDNENFIEKLENLNQNTTGKRIIPHTTQGYKISEVIDENAKAIFAFIIEKDLLIFSSSNLALEEAILHKNNKWVNSLKLKDTNLENDTIFTQTHFNQASLSNFLNDISIDKTSANNFPFLLSNSYQWLKPSTNAIEAVSFDEDVFFEGQKPSNVENLNMIPNSSSYLLNISFSDIEKFSKNLEEKVENESKINKLREKASSKYDFNFIEIYKHFQGEIKLCSFDNSEQSTQNKVLIIKQKGLINPLKIIARNVAEQGEDDVFSVQYGSFLITSLGIKEFPNMLLGGEYSGFKECYFTEYNDFVILASSLTVMQDYLINVSKGDVWSNSAKNKSIIKHCVPANLTFIAENTKVLKGLSKIVNNKWTAKVSSSENTLNKIQAEILQKNSTESRLVLLKNIEPIKSSKKFSNKWLKLGGITVSTSSAPLFLVNPYNKNSEILVQSSDNKLHLFENGKRVWSNQLAGQLVGQIKNVSFSKANAQQLLVVTNAKIYILLRKEKGFEVKEGKKNKAFKIDNFSVFENESDKSQNLTIVAENGNSFKIDKEDLALTPAFSHGQSGQTLTPLPSVIIKGVENAIILEKSGKLTLQNAKGKVPNGFPINLNGIFTSPPIMEGEDNNLGIRVISEQGLLYKLSLSGKILEKRQLYRPDNDAKFSLAADNRNSDWVLMRTNGKEVVVIDKFEKEMFSIKDLTYGKKVLFYYNLGVAGKFFAVSNGYTTYRFYNDGGDNVGDLPIESQSTPSLSYSDSYKKIIMNISTPSSIETWSVKIH
jgi:hypothetical protein